MAKVKVTMEVGSDGVAVITMFNPPVNALAIPSNSKLPLHLPLTLLLQFVLFCRAESLCVCVITVLAGLKEKFDEAARRNDVKAIVVTGNSTDFQL